MVWLLPTLNRPKSLTRFCEAFRATGAKTPGMFIVDREDYAANRDAYEMLSLPDGWVVRITAGRTQGEKLREIWDEYKDAPWVGYLGDDCVPETHNWDDLLISRLSGWNFTSPNDGWQAPKRIGNCAAFSGDLIRRVGYFWPEKLDHLYIDDIWETIGRDTSCWQADMDIMVRHVHATKTGEFDRTAQKIETFWETDEPIFRNWMRTERAQVDARVSALIQERGGGKPIDLTGVSLYIASPCVSGEYNRHYVRSLLPTLMMLKTAGAVVDWAEMPYCSDIGLARAKLFGSFLRSPYDYMIQIDDDIGWAAMDIARMLLAKEDFIAAAGPKKQFPLQFCVNNVDDNDALIPVKFDDTGNAIASEVGGAFVMISKNCARKMAEAYAHMKFGGQKQAPDYAVYDPIIVRNGHRLSEDFAFCYRWRKIGGTVKIIPDVSLSHSGMTTFEGAWADHMGGGE